MLIVNVFTHSMLISSPTCHHKRYLYLIFFHFFPSISCLMYNVNKVVYLMQDVAVQEYTLLRGTIVMVICRFSFECNAPKI